MDAMIRVVAAALTLALCAHARADPRPAAAPARDPELKVKESDEHRYSLVTQGAVGAASGVALAVGAVLLAEASTVYDGLAKGSDGSSCKPCSTSDLVHVRAVDYTGFALIGVGAALLATDIALIVLDAGYRKQHRERAVARGGRSLSLGVRF